MGELGAVDPNAIAFFFPDSEKTVAVVPSGSQSKGETTTKSKQLVDSTKSSEDILFPIKVIS